MINGISTIQQSGLTKCGYTISNDLTRDSGRLDGILHTGSSVLLHTAEITFWGRPTHPSESGWICVGEFPGHQIGGFVSAAPLTEPKNYCGPNRSSDIFGTTPGGSRLDGQTSVIDDFRYSYVKSKVEPNIVKERIKSQGIGMSSCRMQICHVGDVESNRL